MSNELHIFNPHGSVDRVFFTTDKEPAIFFTLGVKATTGQPFDSKKTDGSPVNADTVLFGSMPVSGLSVDQGVDHTLSKTLGNDFLVSEFGDVPVQIGLNGVNFFGKACKDDWGKQNEQALDFYEKYKLSSAPGIRLGLSLTQGRTQAGLFTCVLTKMRAVGPAIEKAGSIPLYTYNLTLIGVRSKGKK